MARDRYAELFGGDEHIIENEISWAQAQLNTRITGLGNGLPASEIAAANRIDERSRKLEDSQRPSSRLKEFGKAMLDIFGINS
jgi:hypothetical protein